MYNTLLQKDIISAIDGKLYNRQNGHFTRHLKANNTTYQEYYEKYITGVKTICLVCKSKPLQFYQKNHTYAQSCGTAKCRKESIRQAHLSASDEQLKERAEKRKKTVKEKYGVEYITQSNDFIENNKQKFQEIMDDGRTRKEHQQEKVYKTKQERYGDAHYNAPDKISEGWKNLSVDEINSITENRRKTNMERYGVETILVHPDVTTKSRKGNASIKDHILPNNEIIGVRGVEGIAFDILLETFDFNDVVLNDSYNPSKSDIPIFEYVNNNRHKLKYYPDILIKSENKIIEAKSRWWYDGYGGNKYKGRKLNNLAKRKACIDAGYKFEFWIQETDGEWTIIKDGEE